MTRGGSRASWASRSTSSTWSASSSAGVMRPFVDAYLRAARPARASTATRPSSSGRCWAGRGRCTAATRWPRATTPACGRCRTPRDRRSRAMSCWPGVDADKDQSYFLYGLRQEQLAHSRFPAGRPDQASRCAPSRTSWGSSRRPSPRARSCASCPAGTSVGRSANGRGWQPLPGVVMDADGRDAVVTPGRPPTPSDPSQVALSPDGNRAYVTNHDIGAVTVINTTPAERSTRRCRSLPDRTRCSSPPTDVGCTSPTPPRTSVSVLDPPRTRSTATIAVGHSPEGLAITPDGKLLYVANADDGTVTVVDTATAKPVGSPIAPARDPTPW